MAWCIRRRTTTQCITTSLYVKVRRPLLNLLKAGNRALMSIGFMTFLGVMLNYAGEYTEYGEYCDARDA